MMSLFEHLEQPEKLFENKTFDNCTFKHCNFNAAKFINCKFVDCEFVHCNLSLAKITGSSFSSVDFKESKLAGINWTEAKWPYIKLNSPIGFYECNISHSSFFELDLSEMIIESCKAHEVDFRGTKLSYANFTGTDFHKSLFIHTKLHGADFTNAVNYSIDISMNDIKKAKFSFPEAISLLSGLEIEITGL